MASDELANRVVRAYHGTDITGAARIIAEQEVKTFPHKYDWLGSGAYFWEDGRNRAWRWAEQQHGTNAAVIGVDVRLGVCLNLVDSSQHTLLQVAYEVLREEFASRGEDLPVNREGHRALDCLVVNYVCAALLPDVETVRAAFEEGDAVYPGAMFTQDAHVHLCVKQPTAYAGVFEIESR